ncbi:MAG: S41 family peptidase [Planctomycetota bacterium]
MRLLLLLLLAVGARASEETLRTFDAMKGHVERYTFKGAFDGIDWDALCRRYRPLADRAKPGLELHGVLNRLLGELKVSHAAILEAEVYGVLWNEVFGKPAPTWGFMLEETVTGHLFVRTLYEGGPAAEAGVLFGDRVVNIEGEDALRSKRLLPAGYDAISPGPRKLVVSTKGQMELRLTIQRTADPASQREVVVKRRTMSGLDAMRKSVRIVERDGFKLGTLHMWYCQPGIETVARAALDGPLQRCDAFVCDLRGRGGNMRFGNHVVSQLQATGKPLVFLIDGLTRSAKEIVAWRIREDKTGRLVGTPTAGAVCSAWCYGLPDGSYVMLPLNSGPFYGRTFEGHPTEPHDEINLVVPYAAGKDTVLEKGFEVAVASLKVRANRAR